MLGILHENWLTEKSARSFATVNVNPTSRHAQNPALIGRVKENTLNNPPCPITPSLVSPVSLSLLQTLVIFPRSANIHHQGTEISQPLSVLPHLGAWEKRSFFQNDGLTECKITRFMILLLTLLKMR